MKKATKLQTRASAASPGGKRDGKRRDRSATIKMIRRTLGRSQTELAAALGISAKAVQSYEQGWRRVPARVLIQLLVLLALFRKQAMDSTPCWEIRHCAPAQRDTCPAFLMCGGQFCWFVGAQECRPKTGKIRDDTIPCMQCPVVKRLLLGPKTPAGPKPPA